MELNSSRIVWVNGAFMPYDAVPFHLFQRTIFGDYFFETIRHWQGRFPLLPYHVIRIHNSANVLGIEVENVFLSAKKLQSLLQNIIDKNEIEGDVRIRILFSRQSGLGYLRKGEEVNVLIDISSLPEPPFRRTEQLNIYDQERKLYSPYSHIKPGCAALYGRAKYYAQENEYNDVLICNEKQEIVESTNANIFLLHQGQWKTPPIESGCVDGVMRQYLLKHLYAKESVITKDDLQLAEEVFLTNAVQFISPVSQFRDKRYDVRQVAKVINQVQTTWHNTM